MRFNPLPDFRNSKAERLYVGERKFSATEIRFPGRHSPREPSRAKPQTEPQAGSNGFAFSKQKMRKAGWPLGSRVQGRMSVSGITVNGQIFRVKMCFGRGLVLTRAPVAIHPKDVVLLN